MNSRHLVLLAALLLVPGLAFASGEEVGMVSVAPTPEEWRAIGIHAINFVLLIGVLAFVLRSPVKDALNNRAAGIKAQLEEANNEHKTAQDRFDEVEARLARFDKLVEQMRMDAETASQREAEHIAERTQTELQHLQDVSERTIREETRKAHVALQKQAVDLALRLAEERMRGNIDGNDHQRLANDFLSTVNKEAAAHG